MNKKIWRFERDDKTDEWGLVSTEITGLDETHVYLKTGRLSREQVSFTPEDCLRRFVTSMKSALRFKQRMIISIVRGIVKAETALKERKQKDGSGNDDNA